MSTQAPDKKKTPLKWRLLTIAPPILLLAGILVLLYPVFATQYNNARQERIASEFSAVAEQAGPDAVAAHGLLLGAQRLEVLQAGAAGLVSLDDPVDEGDVGAAGSLTGAVGLGILAKRAQIDHGTSVVRAPHRASGGPM